MPFIRDRGSKPVSNASDVGAAELLTKAKMVHSQGRFLAVSPYADFVYQIGIQFPCNRIERALGLSTLSLKMRTMGVARVVAVK